MTSSSKADVAALRAHLCEVLPPYAVPTSIRPGGAELNHHHKAAVLR